MFGLLRQFSQLGLAGEVHSPACVDGKFVASDNFVGNSDEGNKLKAKGVNLDSFGLDAALPLHFQDHCTDGNVDNSWMYNKGYLLGAN